MSYWIYTKTEYQRCIVHQVRNTLKYVSDKDKKAFANDLKTIYHASNEEAALSSLDRVTSKWKGKYLNSMKSRFANWDAICPIFKFSSDVRKIIYTTNAIESLNSTYRKLNRQRSVFPSDKALLKALHLSTFEAGANAQRWIVRLCGEGGKIFSALSPTNYALNIKRYENNRCTIWPASGNNNNADPVPDVLTVDRTNNIYRIKMQ